MRHLVTFSPWRKRKPTGKANSFGVGSPSLLRHLERCSVLGVARIFSGRLGVTRRFNIWSKSFEASDPTEINCPAALEEKRTRWHPQPWDLLFLLGLRCPPWAGDFFSGPQGPFWCPPWKLHTKPLSRCPGRSVACRPDKKEKRGNRRQHTHTVLVLRLKLKRLIANAATSVLPKTWIHIRSAVSGASTGSVTSPVAVDVFVFFLRPGTDVCLWHERRADKEAHESSRF